MISRHKRKEANAIWGIGCQNAAYLAAICDLKLRFRATTRGRGAIWEIALLKRCDVAFAFGRPLRRKEAESVAPRNAPRMGFSHELGHECSSESCSEHALEFRELLREWPYHAESVLFSKFGVVPTLLRISFPIFCFAHLLYYGPEVITNISI